MKLNFQDVALVVILRKQRITNITKITKITIFIMVFKLSAFSIFI